MWWTDKCPCAYIVCARAHHLMITHNHAKHGYALNANDIGQLLGCCFYWMRPMAEVSLFQQNLLLFMNNLATLATLAILPHFSNFMLIKKSWRNIIVCDRRLTTFLSQQHRMFVSLTSHTARNPAYTYLVTTMI